MLGTYLGLIFLRMEKRSMGYMIHPSQHPESTLSSWCPQLVMAGRNLSRVYPVIIRVYTCELELLNY